MIAFLAILALLPTAAEAKGQDMSAVFAKLTTCSDCTAAGYGWCTIKRRCGGFANKKCGIGPQYVGDASEAVKTKPAPKPKPAPTPKSAPKQDMSAIFAKLTTCSDCIAAGYGWCTIKRRCGGFANQKCGLGPQYVAEPATTKKEQPKKKSQPKRSPPPPPPSGGGTDMRATFAKLRSCDACISAGFGWCPNLRKCGGFANKQCGIGPRYISADPAPDEQPKKMKPTTGRNGLWESKAQRKQTQEADAPPVAEVPPADKPKEAPTLLYAGPVKRTTVVVDAASGAAATQSTVTVAPSALSSNESSSEDDVAEDVREALMRLPTEALVSKVMELEAVVAKMKALL